MFLRVTCSLKTFSMKKCITLSLIIFLVILLSGCHKRDHYQVYAVKYLDGSVGSASNIAMGADPNDSVRYCFMIWLLKGDMDCPDSLSG